MASDFELVIVGGGPAGCATTLFLCAAAPQLRDRILIVDKATFPRDKICAGAIGARGEQLLASIGVRVEVPSVAVHGLGIIAGSGQRAEKLAEPIGRVVRRLEFDAALLAQVRERGIAVREAVRVDGLERRGHDVLLHTSAGDLSALAVVGADGVGSTLRRAIGIPPGPYHAQVVEVDTPRSDADLDNEVLWFDIGDRSYDGYAWQFPTLVESRVMMCRGVYQLTRRCDSGEPRPQPDVAALLEARLAERRIDPEGLCFKRFAERGLPLYQPTAVERVLLVGEAAGIDPVLGEGIPQAILYGHTAAAYLARCARNRDYRFGDYRSALRRARVGIDLRIRALCTSIIYGRSRPIMERFLTRSPNMTRAGIHYFAGKRTPRAALLRAGLDLGMSALATIARGAVGRS